MKNEARTLENTELRFQRSIGPYLFGSYHIHKCKCGVLTTGTGNSLCPKCAHEAWKTMK